MGGKKETKRKEKKKEAYPKRSKQRRSLNVSGAGEIHWGGGGGGGGVVWGEKGVVRQEIEAIWNLGLGVMGFV